MLKGSEFWIATGVALVAALLAVTNVVLFDGNRARQANVTERAQFVQQSVQLEVLYREIVKALADLSVRQQDPALTNLLASRGITVTATPAPVAAPAAETRKGGR